MLANIYLNEYDQEMARRGVPVIRYADDIVVLAKANGQQSGFWKPPSGILREN